MKDLFSIIVTNYNQEQYISKAILSVLKQSYKNVEIIVADDASKVFPKKELETLFAENNFDNYKFLINKKNVGTVKTVHHAIKQCKGKYILFFAADDCLYDKEIIKKYVQAFEAKNVTIVSSVCLIYDSDLNNVKFEFPTKDMIKTINTISSFEQYKLLINGTLVAPGATAFLAKELKKRKYVNSKNTYIEDWELFIKMVLNNNKIYVVDTYGLKHRGGGISENKNLPQKMKMLYLTDFDNTFKKLIIPYYDHLTKQELLQSIQYYSIFESFYDYQLLSISRRLKKLKKKYINVQEPRVKNIINHINIKSIIIMIIPYLLSMVIINAFNPCFLCIFIPTLFLILYVLIKIIIINFKNKRQ